MRFLALTDSKAPWHSFWIRFGQYKSGFSFDVEITDDCNAITYLKEGDQIFLYRYSETWGDIYAQLRLARNKGVRIIADIDDYLWEANGWSKKRLMGITKSLKECNLITCSTFALRDILSTMFPFIPIIILENTAPRHNNKNQLSKSDNLIRIGWTGAPWTRKEDIEVLKPLADWVQTKQNIKFMHIGHLEQRMSFANALSIPESMVEKYPIQSHTKYIESIDFDIGLAPLKDNAFNQYKSPIKVIEYSSLGIPWIASNLLPYREICIKWGWRGRLCSKPEDWIELLNPLLIEARRLKEGKLLKDLCHIHSSYDRGVEQWEKLILGESRTDKG